MKEDFISICDVLGVFYDLDYVDTLGDCSLVEYFLEQIYKFLGGSEDA